MIVAINKVDLAPKHDLEPLKESSAAAHGHETDESEANDFVTYATTRSTKSSKKVKPAAQNFSAIQALWQQRLPNAGLCVLQSTYCFLLLINVSCCFTSVFQLTIVQFCTLLLIIICSSFL